MTNLNFTEQQRSNFINKRNDMLARSKPSKRYTAEQIVLLYLNSRPSEWFYTWELQGVTNWGFLSHATHATLRRLEQKKLIYKQYIGKYVVYTHKENEKDI